MPDRWPAMVGVVGFDGGHRPTVALALPPDELTSAEEGEEGGPGPGPGACCYNDGTCDTISETDCIAAGGTFQGEGTTCDDVTCTGACCEPGCVENTTPDGCADDGGTFQGFGTTCDPDPCPPTGACCVDSDCTIETESDCSDMGGTYQGDDTTCDPNPCLPPCLCGGFLNPDDGLYYNTKNYINTNDDSTCPSCPTCLCFSGPNPDPIQYPCGSNRWTFCGTYPLSRLLEEHYDEECNLVQTFEDVDSGWYCCCFSFCDDETTCTPYIPGTCPPCEGDVLPLIWTHCGTITTTVEYSDPCIPV